MNDETAVALLLVAFWSLLAVVFFQRFWTIRRLRNKVEKLTHEAIARSAAVQPAVAAAPDSEEMRRIQQRLQVLERITVEKENSLSREIEDLRAAG
jgi:Tfp pilus assembly protein FimT